ncbi:EAL and modified HD-GYP domain-containing signal transduction protein [Chitinivorax tropicus]|uniref:EAL and modified HD-GYP domain-containing signal transduction protein n=1 Tax=Chitinivorax tropicus TaxID=714531 RepID=A0A840MHU1_9PROT|nr:HDOD domain-containing protein [Chitinivorax tropicus]MBB5018774.1 EAL and modified HD-GYP domain-containing signal transduction protein [Chitinivorax tropicus]
MSEQAPVSINGDEHDDRAFICREAILNRQQRVIAYEFLLHKGITSRARILTPTISKFYDVALIAHLLSIGIDRMLGKRAAFVSLFTLDSLFDPGVENLPAKHIVLSIDIDKFRQATPDQLNRVNDLRQGGFRFACLFDGKVLPEDKTYYALAQYLTLDLSRPAEQDIAQAINTILGQCPHLELLVKNILVHEEFSAVFSGSSYSQQIEYFQGPFVTSREPWEDKPVEASKLRIIELLNKVKQDEDPQAVADSLKRDPVLLFKILRYVNSPLTGLRTQVETAEQALMVLGRDKLYSWLSLLLFVANQESGDEFALLDSALIRARLIELTGARILGAPHGSALFLTGIFSLLDILLKLPLHRALGYLKLPDALIDALVNEQGDYYPFLELALACETGTPKEVAMIAARLGLTEDEVNEYHVQAIVWANQLES